MGIVRIFKLRLLSPYETAFGAVVEAMRDAELEVNAAGNPISAKSTRSLRRNRWASEISVALRPEDANRTLVDWTIDMAGDKHFSVLDEVLTRLKVPVDDLGVEDALERLGKMGRFFGAKEARELFRVVQIDERVVELAQGLYNGNQGMLVLTNQRLFFFDKKFLGSHIEEFDLSAITSLGQTKAMGGETINISISGRSAEIKQVAHGRSDVVIRAFRQVKRDSSAPRGTQASETHDPADQIRRLAELHDAGILTDAEFDAKKADLLRRI
ncbi:hypothetical protein A2J03_24290 [Rhodococcus sp. EPR-157]|uniref:SHOCT domain-containing protein n=1 Tax=Rhodococcus sp. EPR-157 TaxID=1813677 RepID=UPI0007BB20C8|nr:SHOCT domain-containing protein [Rhodococcus sp. EPR-157]KZF06620.1 hypothetical protein A2J03_24290 [Rhodococcus sp. EPR-157]